MKHAHVLVLEQFYSQWAAGNLMGAVSVCADGFSFQVPGKSKLAGKFNKDSFVKTFVPMQNELSGGSFKFEIHDLLASDLHATVLASSKITRNGKTTELRTVHVWRFESGKPLAGYEYPRDLYAFDDVWS